MAAEAEVSERENRATIAAQKEVLGLKENIIDRQRALNITTSLLGLITLAFAIFAFVSFRRKKSLNILLEQKIRARTIELELSRDELMKNLREMNLRVTRASGIVNDSINRIEGLCCTAVRETCDTRIHSYLRTIRSTADAIGTAVHTVFRESTSGLVRMNIDL